MEPKPSRIPRRISVEPSRSSASFLESYGSYSGGRAVSDAYYKRETSVKLDPEFQGSSLLNRSSRDYGFTERENCERSWKLSPSSSSHASGSFDRPWLGSRTRLLQYGTSLTPLQPTLYSESERPQGACSRLYNQVQDCDSKRPKLSYSGGISTSGAGNSSNGLSSISDSSWRYGHIPRSSSMILNSGSGAELTRERREMDRRPDPTVNSFGDYSPRNGGLLSSYAQDRVSSSYAQGARPKENSFSSLRLNASSLSHQLPPERHSSLFSRESSRSSSRSSSSVSSRDTESPQRLAGTDITRIMNRCPVSSAVTSERTVSSPRLRSLNEPSTDSEGLCRPRQLLSRLASSMSSTFFSRRSSQDLSSLRSFESECLYPSPRDENSSQGSAIGNDGSDVTNNRSSESSPGFSFLRRRRRGLSSMSQSRGSESDVDCSRQDDSENRSTSSWISSSFRNRCTPLFSRRRREGRDESVRMTPSSDSSCMTQQLLKKTESREDCASGEETEVDSLGATAPTSSASSPSGNTASSPVSDTSQTRRNLGVSGLLSNPVFRLAMPHGLGSSLSDNVMITVDILSSDRPQADGQEENSKSQTMSSRDPEKLKKIEESLLLEDSDDEGDLCRICQMGATSPTDPLIEPCRCTGSLQYVHQECMKKWLQSKINSGSSLEAVTTCELCKEKLHLNFEDFDIHELHRAHAHDRAEYEFISSGLYLVVLLHLCEQRFSDMLGAASEASTRVRFINLARTLQAHMEDLETSDEESEDEEENETNRAFDIA
nr:PREDICTED: E3 ubiquitin-protein ligase MARCH7 [Latimeria chalumnae]|eukprot:XP_014353217.1 PREDICTED: E3 ubiquitin-protein ligase MARCH7 [Latimeria chalumnae]